MVKVERLYKKFGAVKAVEGVSFELEKGKVVGLLGVNGAGKTTVMRMMTGYLTPDEGRVSIEGMEVRPGSVAAQQSFGYLPEGNPLYKDMLVSEFLGLSAQLQGLAGQAQKEAFDFVVEAMDIGSVFYRPLKELSKGFRQRVGLAAAILHRPPVLILDEPTEGLDPNQRAEIRRLIQSLSKDRVVLMSTHIMQEASAICDRILILHQGKLVADDTPDRLGQLSKSQYVFKVELEGVGVEEGLRSLVNTGVVIERSGNGGRRVVAKLSGDSLPQPELSRLVQQRNWIIWNLHEERKTLEEVFQSLTEKIL